MFASQLVSVLNALVNFYEWLVIIWCLLSWFPIRQGGIIADFAGAIDTLVSPYMNLFRRFIPPIGGIDFSPVVGVLVLDFLQRFIVQLIYSVL